MFSNKSKQQPPARRRTNNVGAKKSQPKQAEFRKNRTLTGSRSTHVRSTNELNSELLSPRAHAHHLHKQRNRLGIRLMLIVLLLLVTYLTVSMLIATVTIRSASSEYTIDRDRAVSYEKSIDEYLSKSPFERMHPLLNQPKLLGFLQDTYPEIEDISMELSGELGKSQTIISVRTPVARWVINEKNEFVDKNGIVFSYNARKTPPLEIVDRNQILSSSSQTIVASSRFLAFVGTIVGDMRDRGYSVTKASIPPLTTRQIEIQLKGVPYMFKMTIDRSAGEQAEDATRVATYLKKESLQPDYVDVRVQGRAFYK